jgi:hypothetical protein
MFVRCLNYMRHKKANLHIIAISLKPNTRIGEGTSYPILHPDLKITLRVEGGERETQVPAVVTARRNLGPGSGNTGTLSCLSLQDV